MDASSLLETTAEVSVAFTGFIGIFLVLSARDGRFLPQESFQIRLIVLCSVAPVFLAAAPLLLGLLGIAGPMQWRLSSVALGIAVVAIAVTMARQLGTLPPGEGRSLNYGFVLGVVVALSCVANVVGWPRAPSPGVYLLSVWAIVGIAAGNFIELLFRKVLKEGP